MKKVYVGNLPFNTSEEDLIALFSPYGSVASATVVKDKVDGRSKGFAFVEFDDDDAADKAVEELDGSNFGGRTIKVNEARPAADKSSRFGDR